SGWLRLSFQSPVCSRLLGVLVPLDRSLQNLLSASVPAPAPPRAVFGRVSTSPEWASRGRAKIDDRGSRIEDGGSRIPEQNCSDLPFPYPCSYPILHPRPSILDPPSSILDPRLSPLRPASSPAIPPENARAPRPRPHASPD